MGLTLYSGFDPCLNRFEIETCAALHRGKLNSSLSKLAYHALHKHKAPEFIGEPIVEGERAALAIGQTGPLERVQPQIDNDRPIHLLRRTQPAIWLIGEPIFIITDANGRQSAFREIEDLIPLRRTLARNHICLIVTVQMNLICRPAELLTLF